ncbi:MAG: hypothetical protein ABIY55_29950, partial [Kofleriaceae bacterium]
ERLAIFTCLNDRIVELRNKLTMSGTGWAGDRAKLASDPYLDPLPAVYRSPGRIWPQDAWHTAISGNALGYASQEQAFALATLFAAIAHMEQLQAIENAKAATLGDLAFAGPLTASERRADLKILAELSVKNGGMRISALDFLRDAASAGYRLSEKAKNKNLSEQRNYRGECVREPAYPAR